jgi:hypothetical protein
MSDWAAAAVVLAGSIPYTINLTITALRARASRGWPRVSGVLEHSEVLVAAGMTRRPRGLSSAPYIAYEYRVNGSVYGGSRVRFGPMASLGSRRWIGAHVPGSSVSVAYDPRKPVLSTLVSGVSAMLMAMIALMLAVDALGVWWLLVLLKR